MYIKALRNDLWCFVEQPVKVSQPLYALCILRPLAPITSNHLSCTMKFTNAIMTFLTFVILPLLSSMSLLVGGFPLVKRDVWDPRILEPTSSTVWKSGQVHKIIWYVTMCRWFSENDASSCKGSYHIPGTRQTLL